MPQILYFQPEVTHALLFLRARPHTSFSTWPAVRRHPVDSSGALARTSSPVIVASSSVRGLKFNECPLKLYQTRLNAVSVIPNFATQPQCLIFLAGPPELSKGLDPSDQLSFQVLMEKNA